MSLLTIIIPAYNEEDSLKQYLPEVIAFCKQRNYELIIVNDGSSDATKKNLESFSNEPILKLLNNKVNRGYGGAIKRGIAESETEFVVTIDADGQHTLTDIDKLLMTAQEQDADMVVGNRGNNSGLYRGLGKWLIRGVAKMLMPLAIEDINSGMKLYNTGLAKKYMLLCPDTMAYSDIILFTFIYQRCRVIETPIQIKPRTQGASTINTMTAVNTLREILNIVILFNPITIFLPVGLFFIIISVLWSIPILLAGRGVSVGALLGFITGILILFIGLLSHQISAFRKERL
jgi:glycosyltransferase involved in cell wall biosynthesis